MDLGASMEENANTPRVSTDEVGNNSHIVGARAPGTMAGSPTTPAATAAVVAAAAGDPHGIVNIVRNCIEDLKRSCNHNESARVNTLIEQLESRCESLVSKLQQAQNLTRFDLPATPVAAEPLTSVPPICSRSAGEGTQFNSPSAISLEEERDAKRVSMETTQNLHGETTVNFDAQDGGRSIAAPFTPTQKGLIERRILSFLTGYVKNDKFVYKEMTLIGIKELYIQFDHIKEFDPPLATLIRIFLGRIQERLVNAATFFFEELGIACGTPPKVKVCDVPSPKDFIPLTEFWNLPGNHPSEEATIFCGDFPLNIVRTTPAGRISFINLVFKLFDTMSEGNCWGGDWDINHVMINGDYEIEIYRPYSPTCKKKGIINDFDRCAGEMIPRFKINGELPCFFQQLDNSMRKFLAKDDPSLTLSRWRKFFYFIAGNLGLKAPLVRSNFYDHAHEVLQSVGKNGQNLLAHILGFPPSGGDWRKFLFSPEKVNPIISYVYTHNKKKKQKNERKNAAKAQVPVRPPKGTSLDIDLIRATLLDVHCLHAFLNPRAAEEGNGNVPQLEDLAPENDGEIAVVFEVEAFEAAEDVQGSVVNVQDAHMHEAMDASMEDNSVHEAMQAEDANMEDAHVQKAMQSTMLTDSNMQEVDNREQLHVHEAMQAAPVDGNMEDAHVQKAMQTTVLTVTKGQLDKEIFQHVEDVAEQINQDAQGMRGIGNVLQETKNMSVHEDQAKHQEQPDLVSDVQHGEDVLDDAEGNRKRKRESQDLLEHVETLSELEQQDEPQHDALILKDEDGEQDGHVEDVMNKNVEGERESGDVPQEAKNTSEHEDEEQPALVREMQHVQDELDGAEEKRKRKRDSGVLHEEAEITSDCEQQVEHQENAFPLEGEGEEQGGHIIGAAQDAPWSNTLIDGLICSRHVRQHGTLGSRNTKGEQCVKVLSEVDLVICHYMWVLAEIHEHLLFDSHTYPSFTQADYDQLKLMLDEILEHYNAPENSKSKTVCFTNKHELVVLWVNAGNDSKEGFEILESYFSDREYAMGPSISDYDMKAFMLFSSPPPFMYLNLSKWYNCIREVITNGRGKTMGTARQNEDHENESIDAKNQISDDLDAMFYSYMYGTGCQYLDKSEEADRSTNEEMILYGRGLQNNDGENNCFLNAIIQSLWRMKQFRDEVLKESPHNHVDPCVVCELREIFINLDRQINGSGEATSDPISVSPSSLRKAMDKAYAECQLFQEGEMNDASEALVAILRCLHKSYTTHNGDCFSSCCCMAAINFGLDVTQVASCANCYDLEARLPSFTFCQHINIVSLMMQRIGREDFSFDKLLREAMLFEDELPCEGCHSLYPARYILSGTFPNVFTVVLGWQDGADQEVMDTLASISSEVDLSLVYYGLDQGTNHILKAMVCYYEKHYSCFAISNNGHWVMYNDQIVEPVGDLDDVIQLCRDHRLRPQVLFFEAYG